MSTGYYVRIRGRVSGPFEVDQLKSMIQRGRFSRAHEVSDDGTDWRAAANEETLFPNATPKSQQSHATPKEEVNLQPVAAPPKTVEWHYSMNGEQLGPTSLANLQSLLAQGSLNENSKVWTNGMGDWRPIKEVPDLAGFVTPKINISSEADTSSSGRDRDVVLSAARPNGWLLFLVICVATTAVTLMVFGIWLTASGFEEGGESGVIHRLSAKTKIQSGLTALVLGATALGGGYLMNNLRMAVQNFARSKENLASVFQRLHSIVVYVSIIFIIYLVGFLFLVIDAISSVGAVS